MNLTWALGFLVVTASLRVCLRPEHIISANDLIEQNPGCRTFSSASPVEIDISIEDEHKS